MRKPTLGLLALAMLALPTAASAGGLHLELSVGSGVRTTPSPQERIPTNLGATLGFGITDMLKLQVGAIANLGDVQASVGDTGAADFDVDLRGMLVIAPPLFPLYLRGIVGITDLVQGKSNVTYGGALGVGFGLLGIGAFIEGGAMQRTYAVTLPAGGEGTEKGWQVEGRLGISIG